MRTYKKGIYYVEYDGEHGFTVGTNKEGWHIDVMVYKHNMKKIMGIYPFMFLNHLGGKTLNEAISATGWANNYLKQIKKWQEQKKVRVTQVDNSPAMISYEILGIKGTIYKDYDDLIRIVKKYKKYF